jgi:hypothetical protein
LTPKRYHHLLSPTAQEKARALDTIERHKKKDAAAGEGERFVLYTAVRSIFERDMATQHDASSTSDESTSLLLALKTLLKIDPYAGDSRDIWQLLVEMIETLLTRSENIRVTKQQVQMTVKGRVSVSDQVGQGLLDLEQACKAQGGGVASSLLGDLL